jgi:5-methylcytosine-specific restriction endonuclease McrA
MFKNYSIVDMINSGIKPRMRYKDDYILVFDKEKIIKKDKAKTKDRKGRPYYKLVWQYTDMYSPLIDGIELRGWRGLHIDHIVPISYGEKNNIPPHLIGSYENLIMLRYDENIKKSTKITENSVKLLNKWGYKTKTKKS